MHQIQSEQKHLNSIASATTLRGLSCWDVFLCITMKNLEALDKLSIRATEDELAEALGIPQRNIRDHHYEWLFEVKFKDYDDILNFTKEFEKNSPHYNSFNNWMQYYSDNITNHKLLKTTQLEWACSALAHMRKLCSGGYKPFCYLKHTL